MPSKFFACNLKLCKFHILSCKMFRTSDQAYAFKHFIDFCINFAIVYCWLFTLLNEYLTTLKLFLQNFELFSKYYFILSQTHAVVAICMSVFIFER